MSNSNFLSDIGNKNSSSELESPIFFLNEGDVYNGSSSHFFDAYKVKGLQYLESKWEIIMDEFSEALESSTEMKLSSPNPPYLSKPDGWKNVYFYNFMWKYHDNCKKYPKTFQLLNEIPFLTFAEVTILEPQSEVLPHIGETNTTMRGHLGLSIPGKLPEAGIEVNNEKRSWETGKIILFSDAHRHRVWNHTDKRRMVLVFDVIKVEYQNRPLWYCSQSLSTLVIKGIDSKIAIIKKLPTFFQKSIHYAISSFWFLYLPFQRKISWLP